MTIKIANLDVSFGAFVTKASFLIKASSLSSSDITMRSGGELVSRAQAVTIGGANWLSFNVIRCLRWHRNGEFIVTIEVGSSPMTVDLSAESNHVLEGEWTEREALDFRTPVDTFGDARYMTCSVFRCTGVPSFSRELFKGLVGFPFKLTYDPSAGQSPFSVFPAGWSLSILNYMIFSDDGLTMTLHGERERLFKIIDPNSNLYIDATGARFVVGMNSNGTASLYDATMTSRALFDYDHKASAIYLDGGQTVQISEGSDGLVVFDNSGNSIAIACADEGVSISLNDDLQYLLETDSSGRVVRVIECATQNVESIYYSALMPTRIVYPNGSFMQISYAGRAVSWILAMGRDGETTTAHNTYAFTDSITTIEDMHQKQMSTLFCEDGEVRQSYENVAGLPSLAYEERGSGGDLSVSLSGVAAEMELTESQYGGQRAWTWFSGLSDSESLDGYSGIRVACRSDGAGAFDELTGNALSFIAAGVIDEEWSETGFIRHSDGQTISTIIMFPKRTAYAYLMIISEGMSGNFSVKAELIHDSVFERRGICACTDDGDLHFPSGSYAASSASFVSFSDGSLLSLDVWPGDLAANAFLKLKSSRVFMHSDGKSAVLGYATFYRFSDRQLFPISPELPLYGVYSSRNASTSASLFSFPDNATKITVSSEKDGVDEPIEKRTYLRTALLESVEDGGVGETYSYDYRKRVSDIHSCDGTDLLGTVSYDSRGRVSAQSGLDAMGEMSSSSYSYLGNYNLVSRIADSTGRFTSYGYDPSRKYISSVSMNGGYFATISENSGDDSSVYDDGCTVEIQRDAYGSVCSAAVGGLCLFSRTVGEFETESTVNGCSMLEEIDGYGRPVSVSIGGSSIYDYWYLDGAGERNGCGPLGGVADSLNGAITSYGYQSDRMYERVVSSGRFTIFSEILFDDHNRIGSTAAQIGPSYVISNEYSYASTGRSVSKQSITLGSTFDIELSKDDFGRVSYTSIAHATHQYVSYQYSYSGRLSRLPSSVSAGSCGYQRISYDDRCMVSGLSGTGLFDDSMTYEYDDLGRLVSAESYKRRKRWEYSYDSRGNIVSETIFENPIGQPPSMSFRDMHYDQNGIRILRTNTETISYQGLWPVFYRGWSMTWERGVLLSSMARSSAHVSFRYDHNGRRMSKTTNGVETDFYWSNGELVMQTKWTERVMYVYGASGRVEALIHDDQKYFLIYDALGSVVAIQNAVTGFITARYSYSPFGVPTMTATNPDYQDNPSFIGNVNPWRFKGYYYDVETGLYWLSSRYYDPEIGRFISPDSADYLDPTSINGLNLYAYCNNNLIHEAEMPISAGDKLLNGFGSNRTSFSLEATVLNLFAFRSDQWDLHWTNKMFDTDWPRFLVLSQEGFEIVNWSLSVYKGSLYFWKDEKCVPYVSAGNIGLYLGLNYKKGIGVDVGASVLRIGYDGKVLDASIEGFTIGITYMYRDGKITFGYGVGWYGWSISIDFVELFKLLFGG
ncbi:MAG: RHS repeat-associated core domain-containing protein [Bacilli bacterium]|nr:RHS repeat-associated core domain-containing protein [Bacilli bacterium]